MTEEQGGWEEASEAERIEALMTQHLAMMQRVIRRETRQNWVMNWLLVGFNGGMVVFNATSWFQTPRWWGYGVALVVHGWTAGYFGWQLWQLWRQGREGS